MPKTIVKCNVPGCGKPAAYKVAAPWSEGAFSELKTYGHACPDHSEPALASAYQRPNRSYPLAPEESVGEIAVYPFQA